MKIGVIGLGGLGHMVVKWGKAFGCEVRAALHLSVLDLAANVKRAKCVLAHCSLGRLTRLRLHKAQHNTAVTSASTQYVCCLPTLPVCWP
jgi:D-arabinose 1-dehydrogenase-like Zn-dependent alcohol dehydrogenase